MNSTHKRLIAAIKVSWLNPKNPIELLRPANLVGAQVKNPISYFCHSLGFVEIGRALTELLLNTFALGYLRMQRLIGSLKFWNRFLQEITRTPERLCFAPLRG